MHDLSSGTLQEEAYADYGNKIKALANKARKEAANTPGIKYSSTAAKVYKEQADRLTNALYIAERNAPRERRAQAIAGSVIKAKIQDNPELEDPSYKKELAKIRNIAIEDARAITGAKGSKTKIHLSDKEWEAIQAGAISSTKLRSILKYMDDEELKERAMPKPKTVLSEAKQAKVKQMRLSGYTIAEIAESIGVSTGTVSKYINS